jgi:hypothetical protein
MRLEAVVGLLQQATAQPEEIEELLGVGAAAHGPETAADAAGHDHAIGIVPCVIVQGCRSSAGITRHAAVRVVFPPAPRPGDLSGRPAGRSDNGTCIALRSWGPLHEDAVVETEHRAFGDLLQHGLRIAIILRKHAHQILVRATAGRGIVEDGALPRPGAHRQGTPRGS